MCVGRLILLNKVYNRVLSARFLFSIATKEMFYNFLGFFFGSKHKEFRRTTSSALSAGAGSFTGPPSSCFLVPSSKDVEEHLYLGKYWCFELIKEFLMCAL